MLTPIIISGYGRSGTTALMSLLGTDSRVAFDRAYPFENRWLTFLAKNASLTTRMPIPDRFDQVRMYAFADDISGPPPWMPVTEPGAGESLPSICDWLASGWNTFSEAVKRNRPQATHYAEKVPWWVGPAVRQIGPVKVIHLVRDPRDVFLSARDFVKAKGATGFGMESGQSLRMQARHLTQGLLGYHETERDDRGRDDAMVLKYEDFAIDPAEVADRLSKFLGLKLKYDSPDITRHHDTHRTSKGVAESVGRWKRESVPTEIERALSALLGTYFDDYGYPPPPKHEWSGPLKIDPTWAHSPDGDWELAADSTAVNVLGPDAWIELPPDPFPAKNVKEIWLALRGMTGDYSSVYWRGSDQLFAEERSLHVPFFIGPHWQIVPVGVAGHPLWTGTIEQLRVDVFNGEIHTGGRGEVRWVRRVM